MNTAPILHNTVTVAASPLQDGELAVCSMAQLAMLLRNDALPNRRFGELGEDYAAAWLHARGHHILSRNWRSRYGELDVVTMAPEDLIVFVEVKTRRSMSAGSPQESVTAAKQRHLRRAGVEWLMDPANRLPHRGVRFDVIAILVHHGTPLVHHIPGAF